MSKRILDELADIINDRHSSSSDKSYTKSLLDGGAERCAKKLGEEAVETVIAAVNESDDAFREEVADLLYHLLVLLELKGIKLEEIEDVLAARMGLSGHEEKRARSKE